MGRWCHHTKPAHQSLESCSKLQAQYFFSDVSRQEILHLAEQDDPINPRDAVDDQLALADRFGLSVGFHNCSQADYLAIVAGYCAAHGLACDQAEALEWAKRRGARSGRVAWQWVTELAGRTGQQL